MSVELGPTQNVEPGGLQIGGIYLGQNFFGVQVGQGVGHHEIASYLRQLVELSGGQLDALVFQQASHQLGARVFGLGLGVGRTRRQQHARLDLDEQCRHEQVFSSQLQVVPANLLHIRQILLRDFGHGNVEHVEILLAYEVEEEVERPFESFEEDFERLGRNIQIVRQIEQRLAIQTRDSDAIDDLGRSVVRIGRQLRRPCLTGQVHSV